MLATHNPSKREEWRGLLTANGVAVLTPELPDVAETEPTYEGNALLKVRSAVAATGQPAIGDDTGVSIDALDGAPGLTTKRWAMALGGWEAARAYLLEHATGSAGTYWCAVAMAWPSGEELVVLGSVRCTVAPPDGGGPGLEPCLWPVGLDRSLARLHDHPIHHRQQALAALSERLGRA